MSISKLKEAAKLGMKGKFANILGMVFFYSFFCGAIEFLTDLFQKCPYPNFTFLLNFLIMGMGIFRLGIGFGFTYNIIKLSRQREPIPYTDFINVALLSMSKVVKLFFGLIIKLIFPVMLLTTAMVLISMYSVTAPNSVALSASYIFLAISFIITLIFSFNYLLAIYCLVDDPNVPTMKILNKSKSLMRGNKLKYIAIVLSFLKYFIALFIIVFTLSFFIPDAAISYIILVLKNIFIPYLTLTLYNFYEELDNNKKSAVKAKK